VINRADIPLRAMGLGLMAQLICVCMAVILLSAQAYGAFHTHEHVQINTPEYTHEHVHDHAHNNHQREAPAQSDCDICLLAIVEDNDVNPAGDLEESSDKTEFGTDSPDGRLSDRGLAPDVKSVLGAIHLPPKRAKRPNAARAPPLSL